MSATLHELMDSRQFSTGGGQPSGTLRYIAITTLPSLESEVLAAARGTAPLLFAGMYRMSIVCTPLGGPAWNVEVGYGIPEGGENLSELPGQGDPESEAPEQSEPDTTAPIGPEYSFSTGGGSKKLLQSIETQSATAVAGDAVAPDFKQAIQVNGDQVEGVEVVTPNFEFTYTRTFGFITLQYIRMLALYTGSVNDDTFYGFEKGELLFLGAEGQCKPSDESGRPTWSITFRFAVQRNRENVVVKPHDDPEEEVGGIIVPLVRGWEYLWVLYQTKSDPDAVPGWIVRVPVAAYVEQVYEFRNFRNLGI